MKDLAKHHFNQGIIAGVISAIYMLVLYLFGIEYLAKWYLSTMIFVLVIVFMARGVLQWRKRNEGYLHFMHAWLGAGIVYMACMLILTLFNILLYNVLHPGLGEALYDQVMSDTIERLQNAGMAGDQMEGILQRMEGMQENWTVLGMIKQYFWGIIVAAILGSIVGAFTFKRKPKHLNADDQAQHDGEVMGETGA